MGHASIDMNPCFCCERFQLMFPSCLSVVWEFIIIVGLIGIVTRTSSTISIERQSRHRQRTIGLFSIQVPE